MLRLKHFGGLVGEFVAFAVINRAWWIIPLVLAIGAAALLVVVGQAAAPVTLYPLF